jgi:hypothetical protein
MEEAVMEWVVKLETRNSWGEMETIGVGRLERWVVGLTAEQLGRHRQVNDFGGQRRLNGSHAD